MLLNISNNKIKKKNNNNSTFTQITELQQKMNKLRESNIFLLLQNIN